MTTHTHAVRLVDPTPAERKAALREAVCRATKMAVEPATYPWETLVTDVDRPEGACTRVCVPDETGVPAEITAAWWTDPLGRRHWVFQVDPSRPDATERWLDGRNPLEWIAPPLSSGWRTWDQRREFVVICRCGVAGTPESIGWMGQTCGPCHDREQEGLATAGVPPSLGDRRGISDFMLTPQGQLVGIRAAPGGLNYEEWRQWHDEVPNIFVRDAPWTGGDRWSGRYPRAALPVASPDGRVLALWARGGDRIRFVRAADGTGHTPRQLAPGMGINHVRFGDGRLFASIGTGQAGSVFIRAWECWPDGMPGGPAGLPPCLHDPFSPFEVSPDGRILAVPHAGRVELRDARTGEVGDRIRLPPSGRVAALLFAPGGGLIIATYPGTGSTPAMLHRWQPASTAAPRGLWSWLTARPDSSTNLSVPLAEGHAEYHLSPDGRHVVATGMAVYDAITLKPAGRFEPSLASVRSSLAFTPDGQLVALTDRGLAVWPWKELFGVK